MWLKLWLKREKKKEATDYQQLPFFLLSGLLDSNQRPRAPQTCALPTALNPDRFAVKRLQRYGVFSNPANFLCIFCRKV